MWKFHARAYIGRGQKFVACRTSASLEATVRRAPIRSLPSRGSNIRALIMFGGLTPTAVDLAWIKFTSLSSVVSGLKLPIYRTDLFGPGFCLEIRDHDSSSDGIGSTHIRFSLFSPALHSDGVMFPSWGFVLFLSCWSRVRTSTFVLVPNNSSWSSSEEAEANVLPFFSPSPSDDFLFFSSLFCSPDPLYVLLGLSASRSYQFHSFHVDQAGQPCYPNVLSAHQVAHSVHVPVLPTTLFWSSSAARGLERRPAPPSGPSPNPPSELEGLRLRLMHTFPLHEGQNAPL